MLLEIGLIADMMENDNTEYKYFNLVKTWIDRVKVKSLVLRGEPERAYIFQILLNKRPEIRELLITVQNGEIDIKFDAEKLPKINLLIVLDAILGNVAKKNCQQAKKSLPGNPETIELLVEGMSCPACALLIEMSLKKDPEIVDVTANLESKKVRIFGAMEKQKLIERIEKLGYKHIVGTD
jgi:P-type Cu+ transporter